MLTVLPLFFNIYVYVCLFGSHIVVLKMEFHVTVIHVHLAIKQGLINYFLHKKKPYRVKINTAVLHSFDFPRLIIIEERFFRYYIFLIQYYHEGEFLKLSFHIKHVRVP